VSHLQASLAAAAIRHRRCHERTELGVRGKSNWRDPGRRASSARSLPRSTEFLGRVSVEAKPILAVGVLRNLVRSSVDWEHVLIQLYGLGIVEHLPSLVEKVGFPAVAEFVRTKVSEYRRKNPPPRMYLSVVRSPRWYAPLLCLGDMRWHFKEQNGPTQRLLAALEANDWRPGVQLPDLDPDQVRDSAKYLRRKTGTHLEWHAEADGRLQWMLRK
jgi:hypothetical protein